MKIPSLRRDAGTIATFVDDPSLETSSSIVRFRKTDTTSRIYPAADHQFVIEDDFDKDGNRRITTRYLQTSTVSLKALRATYTLMSMFFTGFLFIFCLQLLLYVVLDLTIELGATSQQGFSGFKGLGALLALPVLIHGLACGLVIAVQYVKDAWNGHSLLKRFVFGRFNVVVADWISFFMFLGIPLVILIITLFSGIANWWEITSLSWFSCITIFYIVFAITIVYYENKASREVARNRYTNDDDSLPAVIKRSILLRQRHYYSGYENINYLARGQIDDGLGAESDEHHIEETKHKSSNFYTKFISLKLWESLGLFEAVPEQDRQRVYTIGDVKNERPFVTAETWSLDSIYCRPKDARYVAVVHGPQALTQFQMRSSAVCAIIGNLLILLLIASFLSWLDIPGFGIFCIVVLVLVFGLGPSIMTSYRLALITKDILLAKGLWGETSNAYSDRFANKKKKKDEADTEEQKAPEDENKDDDDDGIDEFRLLPNESEGLFQVWETHRMTKATDRMCWIIFGLEVTILFLWPLIALYTIGNNVTATLFLFIAVFTALRTFFNAAIMLEEWGDLSLVDGDEGTHEYWQNQSRLSTITTEVTRSKLRGYWMGILCIFLVAILGLLGLAVTQTEDTTSDFKLSYLPDFEYKQQDDLTYPTCSFGKGLASLGSPTTDMSDYAYLAALAYRDPSITQNELNQWFGEDVAIDNQQFVQIYRESIRSTSPVHYKFITFPQSGNLGMVCIRGTTNAWDALTDAQLWSGAAVFQFLRIVLPIGDIFTPILHRVVNTVSWLSSSSIQRISFYNETTQFVNFLKDNHITAGRKFGNIQVTGHSLGGGLSIITGAQTGTAAVALSGPNALLSRESFDPPVTKEALDTLTFNIIPDRDIVPRLDDVAKLNQAISCTAPENDFVGCHDGRRSLCEIIYSCGTGSRPALCDCTTEFGYPAPTPKPGVNKTFEEECSHLL